MKVFFTDAMIADSESFSPSARKPVEVVASWRALGVRLEIVAPDPVTIEQLALAHDRIFVEAVLAGKRNTNQEDCQSGTVGTEMFSDGFVYERIKQSRVSKIDTLL